MMTEFFQIVSANNGVKGIFGTNPCRIHPHGTKINLSPAKPYALYSVFSGIPLNNLAERTDMDRVGLQVDIYAQTSMTVIQGFEAIRSAVELFGHVTGYSTPDIDPVDGLYHSRMEIDFHEAR